MRQLTMKQKKLLDQKIAQVGIERVYSEADLGDIGYIDELNPCEIFYQNVDRYISDKKFAPNQSRQW